MALLWNTKTLQQETVPDDNVRDALASGQYAYKKSDNVTLIDPEGKPVDVQGSQVFNALNDPEGGYRIETQGEAQKREETEKYGKGVLPEVGAAAAGAARSVTFGLSDLIASKGIAGAKETLSKLKEYQPGASTAGEVAGTVGSLLIPGGAVSDVAKAGEAATSAVRGVSTLGKATEGLVERAIASGGEAATKGIARKIVERAIPAAAGSAVEGAFYGAGQVVSESALGDTDLTAENLLAGAGMGAVLGGVAGGALGAGGVLGEAAVKGLGRGVQKTASAVNSLYERATGAVAHPKLGEMWSKMSSSVSGHDADTIAQFFGKEGAANRARAVMGEEPREEAARKLASLIDESGSMANDVTEQSLGSAKFERIKHLVPTDATDKVVDSASGLLDDVGAKLKEMTENPGEYGNAGAIKRAKNTFEEYRGKIEADMASGEDVEAKTFIHLDELKRRLGVPARPGQFVQANDRFGAEAMRGLYDQIRDHLETGDLYGGAAQLQKAVNKEWVNHLNTEDFFKKNFTVKFGQDAWDPTYRANPSSIRSYLDNVGTTKDDLLHEAMQGHVNSQASLTKTIGDVYDLSPELKQKIQRLQDNTDAFNKTLGEVRDTVSLGNQLRKLDESHGALAGVMEGLGAGGVIGGPIGAGIGAIAGALAAPGRTIRQLAALERATNAVRTRITEGVGGYLSGAVEAAKKAAAPVAGVARRTIGPAAVQIVNQGEERQKRRAREKEFAARSADLQSFLSNPEVATTRLASSTSRITQVAPNVTQAIQTKAAAAANFLYAKMPKPPAPVGIIPQKWTPRQEQLDKWERYVRAVDDPMTVIHDLKRGKLTMEAVEAARTVYPKLYEQIQTETAQKVAELGDKLPYKDQVQLSLLLGEPLSRSTTPQFVSAMQQSYGPLPPEGQEPIAGGETAHNVKFTLADKSMTTAQRIESKA